MVESQNTIMHLLHLSEIYFGNKKLIQLMNKIQSLWNEYVLSTEY